MSSLHSCTAQTQNCLMIKNILYNQRFMIIDIQIFVQWHLQFLITWLARTISNALTIVASILFLFLFYRCYCTNTYSYSTYISPEAKNLNRSVRQKQYYKSYFTMFQVSIKYLLVSIVVAILVHFNRGFSKGLEMLIFALLT